MARLILRNCIPTRTRAHTTNVDVRRHKLTAFVCTQAHAWLDGACIVQFVYGERGVTIGRAVHVGTAIALNPYVHNRHAVRFGWFVYLQNVRKSKR